MQTDPTTQLRDMMFHLQNSITKLQSSIETLDKKLTGKIESLDQKLSGRIDDVNVKIESLDQKLSERINCLDQNLSGKINNLNDRIDNLDDKYEYRLDDVYRMVKELYDKKDKLSLDFNRRILLGNSFLAGIVAFIVAMFTGKYRLQ